MSACARWPALLAGALAAMGAHAGPDEAWLHRAEVPADLRPLLVLVLDRSLAAGRSVMVDEPYDPLRNYGASLPDGSHCDPAKIYWRRGPGPAPDCSRQSGLAATPADAGTGLQCDAARGPLATSGFYIASRAAQWHADPDGGYWRAPRTDSAGALECRADRGRHGATHGAWHASEGARTPWSAAAAREIAWDRAPFADGYIFYAGNFLNYLRTARAPRERPLSDLMVEQLARALEATDGLDAALIHIDDDGPDGGYVARAAGDSRGVAAELQALAMAPPAGSAALAETLAETARWLQGGTLRFGNDARADPAAFEERSTGRYRSPFEHACRPVSLGYLTALEATDDEQASAAAGELSRFNAESGGCGGDCLAALAAWLGATDLSDELPGTQSAPVSWIAPVSTAPLPGATRSPTDPLAYVNLVAAAFQRDAAVPAGPQLSAAGLTPTHDATGGPAVIVGLVAPRASARWPGNLLRYALRAPSSPLEPPILTDRDGEPAIDRASGLPFPDSRSLWSDAPDANLLTGGAAGRLPPGDARRIQTDVAADRLLDAANLLAPGNARIDRTAAGLGDLDPESIDDALAWAASQRMPGDPGTQAPLIVDDPESGRAIAFTATHDGLLHAFDAASGIELWAWMPRDLLPRLPELLRDATTTVRSHGIDGPLVLHRLDADGDGRIASAAGEHQWLIFGLGRGGPRYYALDIDSPRDPRLLWSFTLPDTDLEARAEPVVTRLAIDGSGQSAGQWVVLLGGGYDPRFDARAAAGPGKGNALRIVDAATGRLLWTGGGEDPDLALPGLASLAAAPRALDLDGDGYLDRAYALDVTGGLWRVDFSSGRSASEVATASRVASLGSGDLRFYGAPDVSVARTEGSARLAIAAGSGWIGRPRDATTSDRLFVVFDTLSAAPSREIADEDLHDATDAPHALPPDAPGWFVRLDAHGTGEKIVGSTVTFDHVLRFQTYQPLATDTAAPCGPPRSISRRYALDVRTAMPYRTAVGSEEEEDEPEDLAASGLPPGLRFGFPGRWETPCEGCRPRPFGIAGGETFDPGYAGDPVRTSWRKLVPPPVSP
jgi:type IV pilus assembly protein PilY1